MASRALRALYFALFALSVAALFDAAKLHGNYAMPAFGVRSVPMSELAFFVWYLLWGGLATAFGAAALFPWFGRAGLAWFEKCRQHPRETLVGVALFGFAAALLFRHLFLFDEPITDDESVYELTARNLALGQLTAEPPIAPEFLKNQFVVVDAHRWHGKYPIGHSILLAPFELLGRPDLLPALLLAVSAALAYAVAKRFVGERGALLALFLVVCSPHFVWTHGTLLSQTTSALTMLLATYASFRHKETQAARYLALLGASLGYGVLVRPMPGVLVAAVLLSEHVYARCFAPGAPGIKQLLRDAVALAPPLVLFIGLLLLTNYVQSGSPWTSGYAEVHSGYGMFQNIDGELTNSVGGALVRENAWLFGWPCSLMFLPFAVGLRRPRLFWSLVATTLAYRILVPKTVVSTTGPIYVTEVVPFLCMASAAGMAQVARLLERLGLARSRERVACVVAASFAVAALGFARVTLPSIYVGSARRMDVRTQLAALRIERAVVFADGLVFPQEARTWAYFPPNPWPDLRDDVLYFRLPGGPAGTERAVKLWRERFADRPALVYKARLDKPGVLTPLAVAREPHDAKAAL